MSFSYGYHYCSNAKINCIKHSLDPAPDHRLMAIKELKETQRDIQKTIEELEKSKNFQKTIADLEKVHRP